MAFDASCDVPSRLGFGHRSAVAVNVGSVFNAKDLDPIGGVIEVVEDPVRPPKGAVGAFEFCLDRMSSRLPMVAVDAGQALKDPLPIRGAGRQLKAYCRYVPTDLPTGGL